MADLSGTGTVTEDRDEVIRLKGGSNPPVETGRDTEPSRRGGFEPDRFHARFHRREDTAGDAFIRNLPRAGAMGMAQSQAFTQGVGAATVGSLARSLYGDDDRMERVKEAIETEDQMGSMNKVLWENLRRSARKAFDEGREEDLPDWMRVNLARELAGEYRQTPDFGRNGERLPKEFRNAREGLVNAINFGDAVANEEGFFGDLGKSQAEFYGQIDALSGGRLRFPQEDLDKMGRGHRKALGWAQTMGELVGPSRVVQSALGGAKLTGKAFSPAGREELLQVPRMAMEGAKGMFNLPVAGMAGGGAVGAAYSGEDEAEGDHAGQVAAAAEEAAYGSLSGMANAVMGRWAGKRLKAFGQAVGEDRRMRSDMVGRAEVGKTYGDDIAEVSRLAETAGGLEDIPLPLMTEAGSALGGTVRRLADKLSMEEQKEYSDNINRAHQAISESFHGFRRGLRIKDAPETVGTLGSRTTKEQDANAQAVMDHVNKRYRDLDKEHEIRYRDMAKRFDEHKVSSVRMLDPKEGEVHVDPKKLEDEMRALRGKLEEGSQTGTQVEDVMRTTVTPTPGSMISHAAEATGGLRRFEKGLKGMVETGQVGEGGVSARAIVEFIHNSNEVLRKAERSGNETWIGQARYMKETGYSLLRDAAEQGLLPRDLVDDFLKLQDERKAFHQVYSGDDEIGRATKEMAKVTPEQKIEDFRKGFIARSGRMSHADISALYEAAGPEGKSAVDEFLADTIWERVGRKPDRMYNFYDNNHSLLADPHYAELRMMTDRVLFENIGVRIGDNDVLTFVTTAKGDQIGNFVRVAKAHGDDTFEHVGHRILDEMSAMPTSERRAFLKKQGRKLEKIFSAGKDHKKLDALAAITELEHNIGTHSKYKEIVPGNIVSRAVTKTGSTLKKVTGMGAMTLASMGRAMIRNIVSTPVFVTGAAVPRAAMFWGDWFKYKHMMTTLNQRAVREPEKFAKVVDDLIEGELSSESTQWLRAVGAAMNEMYQPAAFTQEDARGED